MSHFRTLPSGTILPFGGSNPPIGWLLCDGSSKLISSYPRLFAAISTNWGVGDSAPNTFSLPDFRGLFFRGCDSLVNGTFANRDPDKDSRTHIKTGATVGNSVGSYQADSQQTHTHSSTRSTTPNTYTHNHGLNYFPSYSHDHGSGNSGGHNSHRHYVTQSYKNKNAVSWYWGNAETWSGDDKTETKESRGHSHTHNLTTILTGGNKDHYHNTMANADVWHPHTVSGSSRTSATSALTNTNAKLTSENFPSNAYVNFIIKI